MTWVGWRLQRTEIAISAVLLALVAAVLVPSGLSMASGYVHDGLSACAGKDSNACHQAVDAFLGHYSSVSTLLGWFNLVPGIVGVLLAAPLLLDLENGTFRLAWTQSVTRTRWLATRIAVTAVAALLAAGAMTALVTWWRQPLDQIRGRMGPDVFDFEGIVGLGYVLLALALALAIGAVWRRTAPAVIVGFVGYVVARIFTQRWLRERYVAPIRRILPWNAPVPDLNHAWVLVGAPSDRFGHVVSISPSVVGACTHRLSATSRAVDGACLARHGAGYNLVVYQPASRFWELQGIETALFAGVALLLIAFASWWIHHRVS